MVEDSFFVTGPRTTYFRIIQDELGGPPLNIFNEYIMLNGVRRPYVACLFELGSR